MTATATAAQMLMFDIPTALREEYERELARVMFAPTSSRPMLPLERVKTRDQLVEMGRAILERRMRRPGSKRALRLLDRLPDPISRQDLDEQIAVLEDIVWPFPESATVALASLCPA